MVFAVKENIKIDTKGVQALLRKLNEACNTVVVSGVLNGDEEVMRKAVINELGGWDTYDSGPYAGEKVLVPARPFVKDVIEHHKDEIEKVAKDSFDLTNDPNLTRALNAIGKKVKEIQEKTIESNGEGVPGWQKHNSLRTIETKGFDRPLFRRDGGTFPIDYELRKRGK